MPRHVIPKNAGPFKVVTARGGNPLVTNNYTGQRQVRIPCRDEQQANELCRRLNEGDHEDEVFV
jgi:hypothetical protein